jgi:endonuclease III
VSHDSPISARLQYVADTLSNAVRHRPFEPGGDPLDVLIGTILSQSTSGTNSRRAFNTLKECLPTWEDALDAGPEVIEDAIHSGGLARQKSRRIYDILQSIKAEYGEVALDDLYSWSNEEIFEKLGRYKGIGVKTIAIVLMFGCGRDVFPVDTHVHRITRRLGLVRANASADKTYERLSVEMPAGIGPRLHMSLIEFGRTRCTARNPACADCPLNDVCYYDLHGDSIRESPLLD